MDLTPGTEPNFFGKDKVVFFMGQVEDVDDPKRSGRVKVRALGWHPRDKGNEQGGLPTQDLPWAKCLSDGPQQNRVGKKHNYLPGSWVVGFFFDGYDANDPVVIGSFNFTAKVNDENERVKTDTSDGKIPEDTPGFELVAPSVQGNDNNSGVSTITEKEGEDDPSDVAHHSPSLDDSTDGDCPITKSIGSELKGSQRKRGKEGNPEGQKRQITIGDGICGPINAAQEQIQKIMDDMFPPQVSRFISGDQVWNNISGQHMNLNGIFNKIAGEVSSLMQGNITANKGFIEDIVNRTLFSVTIGALPDRDGLIRQALDLAISTQQDMWHTVFSQLIDQLKGKVIESIQNINNQQQPGQGQSGNSNIGSDPITEVVNPGAVSITASIIEDVEIEFNASLEVADALVEVNINAEKDRISSIQLELDECLPDDYDCDDDYIQEVERINSQIFPGSNTSSGGGGTGGGSFLGQLLNLKYVLKPGVFNKSGVLSLAKIMGTEGCKPERLFDTEHGAEDSGNSGEFGGKPTNSQPSSAPLQEDAKTEPKTPGENGRAVTISTPSSELSSAENFKYGLPTDVIIINAGRNYFASFPRIHIKDYIGNPMPVVHPATGEIVAILTNPASFGDNPSPNVSIISDTSDFGIRSDDTNYNITLGGFFVENIGRKYTDDVTIKVIDKDTDQENGEVKAKLKDGRIVYVEVINSGTEFKRIPKIIISDSKGFGAIIHPIMNVIPRKVGDERTKQITESVKMVYCPSKDQRNLI